MPLKLAESQIEQGADLLARVFQHDPMMRYFVEDPTQLSATLSMGLKTLSKLMTSANYLETIKNNAMPEPHWELMFLCVEPSQQGQGIGAILIQSVLAQADDGSMPIYLDSMNKRNLTFYKRHGFEVAAQGQIPMGGPQFWAMLRKPR